MSSHVNACFARYLVRAFLASFPGF
jgi:hypothetical protein